MTERSKKRVCGHSLSGIAVSNSSGCIKVSCERSVMSSRGLCDGPITRAEEFLPTVTCHCVRSSALVHLYTCSGVGRRGSRMKGFSIT
jgi:hypothetical protein